MYRGNHDCVMGVRVCTDGPGFCTEGPGCGWVQVRPVNMCTEVTMAV